MLVRYLTKEHCETVWKMINASPKAYFYMLKVKHSIS